MHFPLASTVVQQVKPATPHLIWSPVRFQKAPLANGLRKAVQEDANFWVQATHMEEWNEAPVSWLQPDPGNCGWGVKQQTRDLSWPFSL